MQCPRCDYENDVSCAYCNHCGTALQNSEQYAYAPHIEERAAPPPEMEYGGQSQAQSQVFAGEKIAQVRPHITFFRVLRSILYVIAMFIAAFGLAGAFISISNGKSQLWTGLGIFFGLGLMVAGVIFFMRQRAPILRWTRFVWWLAGATVGAFMALILEFTLFPSSSSLSTNPVEGFIFGCIILLYGLLLAAVALW